MADAPPADRSRSQPIPRAPLPQRGVSAAPLPTPLTSFVGRAQEVDAVTALLRQADVRLVTLTGPGGVGKTRLALRVAEALAGSFTDGVAFVPLAAITDPDHVLPSLAGVLGIRSAGDRPLADQMGSVLRDRHLLLLLDNLEQIVEAAPLVTDLLVTCPRLCVLVTSRVRLHVAGEHVVPLPPFALPGAGEPSTSRLGQVDAVRLFVARARAARPDFTLTDENAAAVAEVCCRLDGLPLAIELAAVRTSVLPPAALLARLEQRLPLLSGGSRDQPGRLRTMRDAVAWSDDLLRPAEQTLFYRLAVFVGGFDVDAAQAVTDGRSQVGGDVFDDVCSLVDASLLQPVDSLVVTDEERPRFHMLETIREYALERLEASGEAETIRRRHLDHYLTLTEAAAPIIQQTGDKTWLDRLERERGNLRTALEWVTARGEAELGLRLAVGLGGFWEVRGHLREGTDWLQQVLALAGNVPSILQVQAHCSLAWLGLRRGDPETADASAQAALTTLREVDDSGQLEKTLTLLGNIALYRDQVERAEAYYQEGLALCQQREDWPRAASALSNLGLVATMRGQSDRAVTLYEEALVLMRAAGDRRGTATLLSNLSAVASDRGETVKVAVLRREALALYVEASDVGGVAATLEGTAEVALEMQRPEVAVRLQGAAARLRHTAGLVILPTAQAEHDRTLSGVRSQLSHEAVVAAGVAGEALSLAEAVAEAETILGEIAPMSPHHRVRARSDAGLVASLSPRELEVLRLVTEGLSNRGIAEVLGISHRTAAVHLVNILTKLGLESRTAAATYAVRHGIG